MAEKTEEEKEADRKDAEDKARRDAESNIASKVMDALDSMNKRLDAMEMDSKARRDKEEEDRKDAAKRERDDWQAKRDAEAQKKRLDTALAVMVAENGNTSQKERQAQGVLPHSEAMDLARDVLFGDLYQTPRYERLTVADIRSLGGDYPCSSQIEFGARDLEECPAIAWERLTAIGTAAPEGATVVLREHYGRCGCSADSDCPTRDWCGERLSVLVTLDWHGAKLSREYAVPKAT